jgi:hypothetical protein
MKSHLLRSPPGAPNISNCFVHGLRIEGINAETLPGRVSYVRGGHAEDGSFLEGCAEIGLFPRIEKNLKELINFVFLIHE